MPNWETTPLEAGMKRSGEFNERPGVLDAEHPENFDSPGLAREAEGLSGGCRQRSEGCPARPQPASRAALVADISSSAHEALSIDGKHLILIFTRPTRGGEGPARALMHHNQCA